MKSFEVTDNFDVCCLTEASFIENVYASNIFSCYSVYMEEKGFIYLGLFGWSLHTCRLKGELIFVILLSKEE